VEHHSVIKIIRVDRLDSMRILVLSFLNGLRVSFTNIYESRKIQYVKCHMTGRSVSVNEGAKCFALRYRFRYCVKMDFRSSLFAQFFYCSKSADLGREDRNFRRSGELQRFALVKTHRWK